MGWTLPLLILICVCTVSASQRHMYHFFTTEKTCSEAHQFCRDRYTGLASWSDQIDVCPDPDCDQVWFKSCKRNTGGWHWLNENGQIPRGLKVCASVQKKTGTGLIWHKKSCDETLRYACYGPSNKIYNVSRDEKTWAQAVNKCKEQNGFLVSGCGLVERREFVNEIQQLGESLEWWVGFYSNNEQNDINSPCCGLQNGNPQKEKYPFVCYDDNMILVKKALTWQEALVHCRENYGELAVTTDQQQLRMVQARAAEAVTDFVWIGLHYSCFFEEWLWVDGQWAPSDDQNWKKPNERHVCEVSGAMQKRGARKWFKQPSGDLNNFVCTGHRRRT